MIDLSKFSFLSKEIEFFIGVNSSTQIVVATNRGIVCQGTKEQCMSDIRDFVTRCAAGTMRFNVGNNVTGYVPGMRAAADDVKQSIKSYLMMMASSCRCKIEVYSGMNSVMA